MSQRRRVGRGDLLSFDEQSSKLEYRVSSLRRTSAAESLSRGGLLSFDEPSSKLEMVLVLLTDERSGVLRRGDLLSHAEHARS